MKPDSSSIATCGLEAIPLYTLAERRHQPSCKFTPYTVTLFILLHTSNQVSTIRGYSTRHAGTLLVLTLRTRSASPPRSLFFCAYRMLGQINAGGNYRKTPFPDISAGKKYLTSGYFSKVCESGLGLCRAGLVTSVGCDVRSGGEWGSRST
jgi:hypothetical protein